MRIKFHSNIILLIFSGLVLSKIVFAQTSWQSNIVYFGNDNRLVYKSDSEGNRIPDFSHSGYKGGGVDIPIVSVVKTISPISGDNTASIQSAIDEVASMPINSNGFRGAILLQPGTYEIKGTIYLNESGIILRGSGQESDQGANTLLYATGDDPHQRTVLVAGGGSSSKWKEQVSGTKTNVTSDTVYVGSNIFTVQDASHFNVGDNIVIYHPCTDAWLQSIDYGGTHSNDTGAEAGVDVPWTVNSYPIVFNRFITAINGNTITIDTPVFNTLIKSRSQSFIYKYSRAGIKTNIGIENLRIDIQTAGGTDENHAWQAIDLFQLEDSWVKDCTMLHFGQSGVRTNTATRVTVESCSALDPVSIITGERRYNFNAYTASQQILFKDCLATNGRHHYVSNGTTYTSGIVFLDCVSSGIYASSEGHRAWSMALLYDNLTEINSPRTGYSKIVLGLYNRGYYGTSHGWAAAHSVVWNCNEGAGYVIIQKPPKAQNYCIGTTANTISGSNPPAPFNEPEGYIEGKNQTGLNPRSLYLEQLNERLNPVNVIKDRGGNIQPGGYKLYQNYPNPFNPETTINYSVPKESQVTIKVYDVLGSEVATLINEFQSKGNHSVKFNKEILSTLSTGVLFYQIKADSFCETKKMVLLK